TLRLPSRLIRTCPQPRSYSATGGAQARAELPKKWKVFYTVDPESRRVTLIARGKGPIVAKPKGSNKSAFSKDKVMRGAQ
ncbi:MAG: hypothetical protein ACI9DF_005320, partial [Verrucomicrobiales bacterium]